MDDPTGLNRSSYRLEFRVRPTRTCPVREFDGTITDISVFRTEDGINCELVVREEGETAVKQLERPLSSPCACAAVFESGSVPRVRPSRSAAGELLLTTYVDSFEAAQSIRARLDDVADAVELVDYWKVDREQTAWPAQIDLAALTDSRREALFRAIDAGYYEHPRQTTLSELASLAGLDESAFESRLREAEREILSQISASR
ncbi:helix-turn-helix domain-containing protein [Halodesulfurarchaeum sp. HSR-GB]|uniref:helix-turn-helix domain-containing protein n=1 Tax=Halodesulfurarchaeum sp. HSR-GB TaxID=3074077 RepID=UPI0028596145|nr:helix-turn-helix domain-containing protein [Halodesulfurarchaeum sp. HSR-GB]MDR5656883.1 helix-turn-helix domain-containing protein [Halodesulfurarchaeum sp. HSR-GB]